MWISPQTSFRPLTKLGTHTVQFNLASHVLPDDVILRHLRHSGGLWKNASVSPDIAFWKNISCTYSWYSQQPPKYVSAGPTARLVKSPAFQVCQGFPAKVLSVSLQWNAAQHGCPCRCRRAMIGIEMSSGLANSDDPSEWLELNS